MSKQSLHLAPLTTLSRLSSLQEGQGENEGSQVTSLGLSSSGFSTCWSKCRSPVTVMPIAQGPWVVCKGQWLLPAWLPGSSLEAWHLLMQYDGVWAAFENRHTSTWESLMLPIFKFENSCSKILRDEITQAGTYTYSSCLYQTNTTFYKTQYNKILYLALDFLKGKKWVFNSRNREYLFSRPLSEHIKNRDHLLLN